ncbi:MAG TPA: glycosyltransferase family 4 protein, partial [Cyclobacteriaceae bacterium]|nr:glycosyltransferase family 4 protein [Cyclobacteriaceae bacterium]
MDRKIIFINSHPIQYFAPLYSYLNAEGLDVSCWYCSDENVKGHMDRQFGKQVKWDIPLLEGYQFRFFRNYSWKPSLYHGFFGLFNPGMIKALFKAPKSIIVIHGWAYLTHVLIIFLGRFAGHIVCLRGESPLNQEILKSKLTKLIKRVVLQSLLFPFVQRFLYIGTQNKLFYQYYGVQESKLIFTPYAVDNSRFRAAANELIPTRNQLREKFGLPVDARIILFAAKFIQKKRPLDLLEAYDNLSISNKCLVMIGDGELRSQIENLIAQRSIPRVFLPGFVNQTEIVNYYAMADVFVLCSGEGETWGLSVNEALNFQLPVVVSDMAGCADDLVEVGKNGFINQMGNIDDLRTKLEEVFRLSELKDEDYNPLDTFSYKTIADSLKQVA